MKIAVIGGGAGGFFAAINCAAMYPDHEVILIEKTNKLLAKVRVSGGGRCNVTHACFSIADLVKAYPRGNKQLKSAFHQFMTKDTIQWFEQKGVKLKTEEDGRMFPVTDNSETIIECLLKEAQKHKVKILTQTEVSQLITNGDTFELKIKNNASIFAQKVIIATGGSPKEEGLQWLKDLGHQIILPVPSLFTFNIPNNPITQLMGVAVEKAKVRIQKTRLEEAGALLITHWGLSGPAILKTSAWGARVLHDLKYNFFAQISWLPDSKEDELRNDFQQLKQSLNQRQIGNKNPFSLPKRLWEFLLAKLEIPAEKKWLDLSKQDINRLVNILLNDTYEVKGKTTFKEEFVTCGGVSLQDVDFATMESKKVKGLYFTGEVLDIDGVTGGFNFQAAWTTAFIAAQADGK